MSMRGISIQWLIGWGIAGFVCSTFHAEPPAPPEVPLAFSDEIRLDTPAVKLGISPEVGRIVSLAVPGGAELLWRNCETALVTARETNAWLNYGGDKLWPTQQCNWRQVHDRTWPPDRTLDGSPWQVLQSGKNRLVVQSPISPDLNVRFRREIIVDEVEAKVTINNTVEQTARSPFPVFIWSVTQIRPPEFCLLDVAPEQPFPEKLFILMSKDVPVVTLTGDNRALHLPPLVGKSIKVGTLGRWLAAVYPDCILLQFAAYDPAACYSERANMEVFWNAKTGTTPTVENWPTGPWNQDYVELEPVSPLKHLQPGETIDYTVTWRILPRPADATEDQLVEICRQTCQ